MTRRGRVSFPSAADDPSRYFRRGERASASGVKHAVTDVSSSAGSARMTHGGGTWRPCRMLLR